MDAGRTQDPQASTASSKLMLVPLPHSQRPRRRGLPGTCIALGCIIVEEHWAKGPWISYNEQWASLIFAREGHILFITEQWTNLLFALEGELVSPFPGCLLPKESWKQPGVEAVSVSARKMFRNRRGSDFVDLIWRDLCCFLLTRCVFVLPTTGL